MLNWVAGAALVFGFAQDGAQDAAAAAKDDASVQELTGLAAKIVKAENYQFTTLTETDRGSFGGGRGGGGRGGGQGGGGEGGDRTPPAPTPIEGAWKKGLPMRVTVGETVAYKDGDQIVYKNADGEWQLMDMQAGGRGGFGGGRGGGGERGGGGGDRGAGGGGDRDNFSNMRALFSIRGVQAPHELFAELDGKIADVEKKKAEAEPTEGEATAAEASTKVATVVYTGKLTEKGVESFGGGSRFGRFGGGRGGRGGGGGGGGPQMDTDGTFTIEVKAGAITSARFEITRSGSFGERDFEFTTKSTLTFSKVGKTELEVPEDALAHFEI